MVFRERLAQLFSDSDIERAVEVVAQLEDQTGGVLRDLSEAIRAAAKSERTYVSALLEFDAHVLRSTSQVGPIARAGASRSLRPFPHPS